MIKHRSAIILGLGVSGDAAARLLKSRGYMVRVLDEADSSQLQEKARKLIFDGIEVTLGKPSLDLYKFDDSPADLCVVSPGVPHDSRLIASAQDLSISIKPEIDAAFEFVECPIVAVTGSNGKSTLVKLINDTLLNMGINSMPCGNYGMPLSAAVMHNDMDRLVVEVSSFQMERSQAFKPQTAVLLNLQANHLDRHASMEEYAGLKSKLFSGMSKCSVAVVNQNQKDMVHAVNSELSIKTIGLDGASDYSYMPGKICGDTVQIDVAGSFVDNRVMGLTGAAALAVVVENGWDPEVLEETIRSFEPLEFRMQKVGQIQGVQFINNSKATTLSALEASLHMAGRPVRLVCGGRLKEKDVGFVKKMLVKTVASAYVYGEAGADFSDAWSSVVECNQSEGLADAVKHAFEDAQKGDAVMLSPGCASFDQYGGYAERGKHFNMVLEELRRLSS